MATIDVLMPVKNGMAYLEASIASIRNQTFRDWRMIVLDHASSDGSFECASKFAEADSRITVRRFPERDSLSDILNGGLALCDAKYVLRQDADDVSLPQRMAVMVDAFSANPDLICAGSLGDIINGRDRVVGRLDMPVEEGAYAPLSLFRIPSSNPAVCFRLDSLRRVGALYGIDFLRVLPEHRRLAVPALAEDYFFLGQLAMLGRCVNLKEPLIRYRWHQTNISKIKAMEQLRVALDVSRYLADSFAALHGTAKFDPAPFCNHGERLFLIGQETDFRAQFDALKKTLVRVLPPSRGLQRELAFREVLADRRSAAMAAKYASFAARHGVRPSEWHTVKSWLAGSLRRQTLLQVAPVNTAT
ncbi:Glycosyltransferase involved in cell wall bisynthesis [Noviherbaspirillum humi]|uniref:Glycosyltransferase involved in cell wall bisynthesis n=1 Tax=Noviherbaspirillum humi TaxID=1688639 RepID=A0A239GVT6_9BURK|nr:glycosyltransferase [Noviherbaspirillum humi]SNS73227.1 Glycosyltransferase involved in cell wall bisynthesis [Noviherbaspirillum humi]